MTQCLTFTQFYAGLFKDAIEMQQTAAPCGVEGLNYDGETKPPTPLIPNFFCPAVVSVPVGQDWQALDNKLKNFDANSLGIKKIAGAPVPNAGITHGSGGKHITQAGKGPGIRYSYGFVLPQFTVGDDELATLTTQALRDKMYREYLQKILQSMMTSPCDKLQTMKEEERKKYWEEKKRKAEEQLRADKELEKMKKELEDLIDTNKFNEMLGKVPVKDIRDFFNSAMQSPSLSSGVQSPNTFTPQQNLFK